MKQAGFTLLELLLGVALSGTTLLLFYQGANYFRDQVNESASRATNQLELANLAVQITRLGMFAKSCTKLTSPKLALECVVEFTAGAPETVRFEFTPDSQNPPDPRKSTLTYFRGGQTWGVTQVSEFLICKGSEILSGNCIDPIGVPWSPHSFKNFAGTDHVLNDFYRFKISAVAKVEASVTPSGAASLIPRGVTSIQSGFFSRNSAANAQYLWSSWGGEK